MTSIQLQGIAEIILAIAVVALCGWLEYRAEQKKRGEK